MTRTRLAFALVVLFAQSAAAQNQTAAPHDHDHAPTAAVPAAAKQAEPPTGDAYVERILAGVSPNLKAGAGVIRWKADHTYDTVKAPTGRLVCFDRSGEDRRNPYAVQCTTLGSLPRVAQNRRFRATSRTNEEEQAMVDAAEKNGTRVKPEYGAPWININGPDAQHVRTHSTIAVPGATTQSTGLPENNKLGGAWLMDAGTTGAHIMLPGM